MLHPSRISCTTTPAERCTSRVTPTRPYERHLEFDHVVEPQAASLRERFEAVAHSLRDLLVPRWLQTDTTYEQANPKQVYDLSMEFLIGRSLTN
jgi:starch phosphorylase